MATIALTLEPNQMAVRVETAALAAGADTVTITRTSPSGHTAAVRGSVDVPLGGATTHVARDYEAPFDLPLLYTVEVKTGGSVVESATATITVNWDECDAWLVDLARPTNSLPVLIESMRELSYDTPTGVHRVLNRRDPILTSLPAWTPTSELVVLTDSEGQRDQVRALYGAGYPFLLRTSDDMGVGNMYLGVTGFVEERILNAGVAPERRFRTSVVQVARPDPATFVPVPPNTYANVEAAYATYADLLAAVGTYDELAYIQAGATGPVVPWLPDDI